MQHVAIGIIVNAEKKVLIAQRLAHQAKGGLWEFPGGKVEANETVFEALQRELSEEIGILVNQAEPWLKFEYHYPHAHVLLDIWLVNEFSGTAIGAEGQPVRWVSSSELVQYEFPDGNRLIVENLQRYFPRF